MRLTPRVRRPLLAACGLGLASAWACQTPTSMTVEVTTDVPCGAAAARVANVVVGNPESILNQIDAATSKDCTSEGPVGKVVLLPGEDENAEVAFKVIMGVDRPTEQCGVSATPGEPDNLWAGCIIARRRLRFLEGEPLVLEVPLRLDCVGTGCDEASFTTCIAAGHCVPADVDPNDCLDRTCGQDDLPGTVTTGATASSSSAGGEGGGASTTSTTSTTSGVTTTTSSSGGGSGGDGGQSAGGGGAGGAGGSCAEPEDCEVEECVSATCVDGLCGGVPAGVGSDCNLDGEPGVCQADGDCVECVNSPSCGAASNDCRSMECSPSGTCMESNLPNGTPCDGGDCLGGVCDLPRHCENDMFGAGETDVDCGDQCPRCINGLDCVDDGDCQSDVCVSNVCVPCVLDLDCNGTDFCEDVGPNAGRCRPTEDIGADCDRGEECTSGFCPEDGVCCDAMCGQECESCAGGICTSHAADTDDDEECEPDPCRTGSCSGASECGVDPVDTVCGAPSCFDLDTVSTPACDGEGQCDQSVQQDCGVTEVCASGSCIDGAGGAGTGTTTGTTSSTGTDGGAGGTTVTTGTNSTTGTDGSGGAGPGSGGAGTTGGPGGVGGCAGGGGLSQTCTGREI